MVFVDKENAKLIFTADQDDELPGDSDCAKIYGQNFNLESNAIAFKLDKKMAMNAMCKYEIVDVRTCVPCLFQFMLHWVFSCLFSVNVSNFGFCHGPATGFRSKMFDSAWSCVCASTSTGTFSASPSDLPIISLNLNRLKV